MKAKIHPDYYIAKVTCSTCGEVFDMGSTAKEIKIDTCSNCHPFYTGTQSFIQAAGRVEQFNRRYSQKKEKETDKQ